MKQSLSISLTNEQQQAVKEQLNSTSNLLVKASNDLEFREELNEGWRKSLASLYEVFYGQKFAEWAQQQQGFSNFTTAMPYIIGRNMISSNLHNPNFFTQLILTNHDANKFIELMHQCDKHLYTWDIINDSFTENMSFVELWLAIQICLGFTCEFPKQSLDSINGFLAKAQLATKALTVISSLLEKCNQVVVDLYIDYLKQQMSQNQFVKVGPTAKNPDIYEITFESLSFIKFLKSLETK